MKRRLRLPEILNREDIHAFKDLVFSLSGQDVSRCIQCGKCSSGCPIAYEMEHLPNQIIRLIQLNMQERALSSNTFWLCAVCETCTVRCPESIDIAGIMDALRKICRQRGIKPGDPKIARFNEIFLDSIKRNGRVYELGLVMKYNMMTAQPFKDASLGPVMFSKGKLKIAPDKVQDPAPIKEAFANSKTFIASEKE